MPNTVCCLSQREAHALEFDLTRPNCAHHRHISRDAADDIVNDTVQVLNAKGDWTRIKQAEYIGAGKRRLRWIQSRVWRPVNWVLQLVPGPAPLTQPHRSTPSGRSGPVRHIVSQGVQL